MSSLTTALSQANAAASTLGGTLSTGSTGSSSSGAPTGNFDTLLQLLTTQLQNQDPLDPLDTNQFIDTPFHASHTRIPDGRPKRGLPRQKAPIDLCA